MSFVVTRTGVEHGPYDPGVRHREPESAALLG
jgi:hypothetical protein